MKLYANPSLNYILDSWKQWYHNDRRYDQYEYNVTSFSFSTVTHYKEFEDAIAELTKELEEINFILEDYEMNVSLEEDDIYTITLTISQPEVK